MLNEKNVFSSCQETAMAVLEKSAHNIFLTGRAGTGKSFLIKEFLRNKDEKIFPVLASTGSAAVLVGGRTFHSFFGLGIMEGGFEATVNRALKNSRVVKRLRKINGFVLDEVSMISGETLRVAEEICRRARQKHMPWGGARVVVVGDFAQLPPVARNGEKRDWAFQSVVWEQSDFVPLVLATMMRSEDDEFLQILNFVRDGIVNDEVEAYLNRRVQTDFENEQTTFLFPRRETAEQLNLQRLGELKAQLHVLPTEYEGNERFVEVLKKQAPIPEVLQLKESASVMIRINDPIQRFVNGSIGQIVGIKDEVIFVKLKNGKMVEIEKHLFSMMDADGHTVATAKNFPLNLAYAATIHKSQGLTLDHMVCDLTRLWEPGQAYVAMSRLRRGKDMILTGWSPNSIRVDAAVTEFHERLLR